MAGVGRAVVGGVVSAVSTVSASVGTALSSLFWRRAVAVPAGIPGAGAGAGTGAGSSVDSVISVPDCEESRVAVSQGLILTARLAALKAFVKKLSEQKSEESASTLLDFLVEAWKGCASAWCQLKIDLQNRAISIPAEIQNDLDQHVLFLVDLNTRQAARNIHWIQSQMITLDPVLGELLAYVSHAESALVQARKRGDTSFVLRGSGSSAEAARSDDSEGKVVPS